MKNGGDNPVIWVSSDDAVAKVDNDGLVTAQKAGEAIITATCGAESAECTVTVTAKPDDPIEDGIDAAKSAAMTLRRDGDNLIVGGIVGGTEVSLHSIGGVKLRSEGVSPSGVAVISLAGLPRATYLLSVSGLTLKITI